MSCGRMFTRRELTTRRRRFRNARWPVDLEFAWRLWGTRRIIRHEICWRSLREINPLEIKMADERFLIVRLSSLGDVIFTLPMLAALRDTFCRSHIAWVVNARWKPLLEGNPDLNDVITLPNSSIRAFFACGKHLRENNY